jgi:hypothetical protein
MRNQKPKKKKAGKFTKRGINRSRMNVRICAFGYITI